jgi:ComF family protein
MRNLFHYLKKMEAWLLPYTCILCKNLTNHSRDLCEPCHQRLPILTNPCLRCAHPLMETTKDNYCQACQLHARPMDTTYALFLYQAPITQLILELKFKHMLINARILGELMAYQIKHQWYAQKPLPDIIMPIPLHVSRLKERGFNQALEIARPIAKYIQRPLNYQAAQRIKSTAAQATLNAIERQQNIQNAFVLTESLNHQHIAVVDDVITTGETIMEFCHTLKQNGVRKIDVWSCARAYK